MTIVSTEDFNDDRGISDFDREEDERDEEEASVKINGQQEGVEEEEEDDEDMQLIEEDREDELFDEDEDETREGHDGSEGKRRARKVGVTSSQDTGNGCHNYVRCVLECFIVRFFFFFETYGHLISQYLTLVFFGGIIRFSQLNLKDTIKR